MRIARLMHHGYAPRKVLRQDIDLEYDPDNIRWVLAQMTPANLRYSHHAC